VILTQVTDTMSGMPIVDRSRDVRDGDDVPPFSFDNGSARADLPDATGFRSITQRPWLQ
jgi:hypothetical protein